MRTLHRAVGGSRAVTFADFFSTAMGADTPPYAFQLRIAEAGLPDLLEAPTGAGKTAAVALPWLWRRHRHPEPAVRDATPRRLAIALPMRTLVDQVAGEVHRWLEATALAGDVALHVAMGGSLGSQRQWRMDAHKSAIVVGTTDVLVSKLLNRAYGTSRGSYPLDFALLGNGTHVVIDEVQLAPEATATLRQVAAFARHWGTAEPFGLTCMSATLSDIALDTVDNPTTDRTRTERVTEEDHVGELGKRLAATKTVSRLPVEVSSAKDLAATVVRTHRPGTRTLTILNTVAAAVDLTKALDRLKPLARVVLVHSRFRGAERERNVDELVATVDPDGPGVICVSTQVVEAGVDIDSATLITESAPWPSLCQRAGRCNRYAAYSDARLLWLPPATHLPYEEADVEATSQALTSLEGRALTSVYLLGLPVPVTDPQLSVLRRSDFLALFDTAPDLSGNNIDISAYVRDADDSDVQVAWIDMPDGGPAVDLPLPEPTWRCPTPIGEAGKLAKRAPLWRFDAAARRWARLGQDRPRPGDVLLRARTDGGYNDRYGLDAASSLPVADLYSSEREADPVGVDVDGHDAETGSLGQERWVSLDSHLEDTRAQAAALIEQMSPDYSSQVRLAAVTAARLHDIGKAHQAWQDALLARGLPEEGSGPWAKSRHRGQLRFAKRDGFRHELVSALAVAALPSSLMPADADVHLVSYLVAAHHGKIRLQARGPVQETSGRVLGLTDGEDIALGEVLGTAVPSLTVDLSRLRLGGVESWTRRALALRDEYGPFRLAHLEMVVRIADWRASGDEPLPGRETP